MKRVKLNTSVSESTYKGLDKIAQKLWQGTAKGWVKGKASKGRAIDYLVAKEQSAGASKAGEA